MVSTAVPATLYWRESLTGTVLATRQPWETWIPNRTRRQTLMGTEDIIKAEIEEMGRLTPEQENILYNI